MKEIDLRIVKTKGALQEALLSMLKDKPLHMISVTAICREAKINRGTFYMHYGKVEDLFEEYFKEIMKDLTDSYMEPYKHVQILLSNELDPSTIRIFHHVEKYKKFYRIIFSKYVPMAYYYLLFDQVNQLLNQDIDEKHHAENKNMFSAYQANAILGMIIEWHRQDFQKTATEMNNLFVEILNFHFRK
ncbi:TetR/AcrR family transcriptional regulator [Planococcus sp. CP5-4]|uniref:TetR/AcrR family transcriptional regulator n=1 Tax=unclassified Planococcus (in: firmicutes) TaxID=2662419 RepID=UPI001C243E04|nr:TetR/AcrR family transcriptional regulator [Planococcus sp. CP5-4]MBU9672667.1 TetR/AcrR family transcriptional regulator [Planococcus sp. CP5-4_YE]MBV0908441.1 TetR/AcrR family transcriptional regulator [Planococcus sp. CP5-4_UN]MBW6063208.1 TetR/AcrR family transcriptional regulator [Planococcus sp. CP5-4]